MGKTYKLFSENDRDEAIKNLGQLQSEFNILKSTYEQVAAERNEAVAKNSSTGTTGLIPISKYYFVLGISKMHNCITQILTEKESNKRREYSRMKNSDLKQLFGPIISIYLKLYPYL